MTMLEEIKAIPIPKDVKELTEAIHSLFEQGPSGDKSTAVTGHPFIEFTHAGLHEPGKKVSYWGFSEKEAVKYYWHHFTDYVNYLCPGQHIIMWRIKPEINPSDTNKYGVYSRFVIIHKTVMENTP